MVVIADCNARTDSGNCYQENQRVMSGDIPRYENLSAPY